MQQPSWLDPFPVLFPPTELALEDPDGLLAIGGDLTPEWLLNAYHLGIFPWFNPDEPILWWTPNPRCVLYTEKLKVRRSLIKTIRKNKFTVTLDTHFKAVMENCAKTPRPGQDGTWITDKMLQAYTELHQQGYAHSVEVWRNNQLVGGLYGMSLGKVFYGESMFSHESDASKIALVALCEQLKAWEFKLIDTQVETPHLISMGAEHITRKDFETHLKTATQIPFPPKKWTFDIDWTEAFEY